MALSDEILSLLRALDEAQMPISYCEDHLTAFQEELRSYSFSSQEEYAEYAKGVEVLRRIISLLVKSKQEPEKTLTDKNIQVLVSFVEDNHFDEHLNEYFTILALRGITGIVKRWKKLQTLHFLFLPGEKVTNYLRQATTCYLYGLSDAVTILCRAILQYALEEAFELRGMLQNLREINGTGYLEKLIDLAENQ